jgi:hypothetical protein
VTPHTPIIRRGWCYIWPFSPSFKTKKPPEIFFKKYKKGISAKLVKSNTIDYGVIWFTYTYPVGGEAVESAFGFAFYNVLLNTHTFF